MKKITSIICLTLLFLFAEFLPTLESSAIASGTFVQQNAKQTPSASSTSLALGNPTVAGDLLLVGLFYSSTVSVVSVTDSQGNIYLPIGTELSSPTGTFKSALFYAKNIYSGTDTVTATTSSISAAMPLGIYLTEYSGLDNAAPLDASAQQSGSSTSVTSGAFTTSTSNDLLVGFCVSDATCSVGSGLTARSTFSGNLAEDKVVETAGSNSVTAVSNSTWTMQAAAFRPAGSQSAPVISSFTASPESISSAGSSTLSWLVAGNPLPTESIDNGVGTVSGSSVSVSPTQTTKYTLTASNSLGSTTAQATVTVGSPDTTAPSIPSGLQASAFSAQVINFTWSASSDPVVAGQITSGVAGYTVYRNGVQVAVVTSGTSYRDTGLTADTTYSYTVAAYDVAGNSSAQATSVSATTKTGPVYPVTVSANRRYLVDQNNVPFLIVGDAPHSLFVNLSEADAATYFANRMALGFNAVWIQLLCNTYTGGRADGSTYDGIIPFTTPGDFATPNAAYFSRVDDMIRLAAQYGITVFVDPVDTGGWMDALRSNGVSADRTFGQYLGNRYKNFDNIVWLNGNDFQTYGTSSDDAVVQAVALGIKDMDTRHIQTIELNYYVSASLDDSTWAPIIQLDAAYSYYPTYAEVLQEYNRSTFMPTFFVEGNYEFASQVGNAGTPDVLRHQEYWAMLSGATGQIYGNSVLYFFNAGWQNYLNTPGAIQVGYLKALFEAYRWYDLVPDQNHTLVTAGYGTFSSSGTVTSSDYATAALTPDGSQGMVYLPSLGTITVNMARFSGTVTAQWYDPSNGTFTAIAGSPFSNAATHQFTPLGNNSTGYGDWVLVLAAATSSDTTPPAVSLGAPQNGAQVSGSVLLSATASDNIAVAGVQFKLDGVALGNEVTTLPYQISWDTTSSSNGPHAVSAVARDTSNNIASASVNVTVVNPPLITAVAVSGITTSSATVIWSTSNDPSSSQVEYGTTTGYGTLTVLDPTLVISHSVSVGNLSPGTIYHFRVRSTDSNGVLSVSGDFTFTTSSSQPTAITFVQGTSATNNSLAPSIAKAFATPTSLGNLLVAIITFDTARGTGVSLSDTQGNSWQQATFGVDTRHSQSLGIFYAENIKGGTNTVTATYTGSNPYGRLILQEYNGVTTSNSLDGLGMTNGGSGRTPASVQFTTSAAGDLIIGAMMDDRTANNTISAGSGFTLRNSVGDYHLAGESQVQSAAGVVTTYFSLASSSDWLCHGAAFKAK